MPKSPYTIKTERSPVLGLRYIVRFNGVRIGSAGDKAGAEQIKKDHQKARKQKQ